MRLVRNLVALYAIACLGVQAASIPIAQPFKSAFEKRQSSSSSNALVVDLGYEVYQGISNSTSGLNIWKGIRFAAPPTGANRFQAPLPPTSNRSEVIQATDFMPYCPQSTYAGTTPIGGGSGDEDCLFLNVYSPQNATNLPVFVWIHGGGYGLGNSWTDMTPILNANDNSFIAVTITYRLGAFGFLSSDEVYRFGAVNAGILDQHFALQWVQAYIGLFGGNSSAVTIGGESAGGGSVMLQLMAYGGSIGDSLFRSVISASPYLPMQYGYADWVPSQSYYAFASAAGCAPTTAYGSSSQTIFQCLQSQNTSTLQNASFAISQSGTYGTWGFLPVTDGVFVQDVPSQQLLKKKVNGVNLLVGNNADEGPLFTTQNITTIDDLVAWLHLTFPLMSNDDISKILYYYPSTNASVNPDAPDFATLGYTGPTAINQSLLATGQQQRANNIYAETTFVCPSYWMAEAFTDYGRKSYKYQYSVVAATHGRDGAVYFGPRPENVGPDFELAFMQIFGNFITTTDPSLSAVVANGQGAADPNAANAATDWPAFAVYAPYQMNLNQTGGTPMTELINLPAVNVTEYVGPGRVNDLTLVNAYTWEGGRGTRCDFWRSVAAIVPE